jgi:hypothetical protein
VGGEDAQSIGERDDRIGVADQAVGDDPLARERGERVRQALLGARPGAVLVRQPVAKAGC